MFNKVLVANRGEIACRIFRTCERLGIPTVAVFSDADVLSPHVAQADEAIRIGKAAVSESYLNIPAILAAISDVGADAVHPGYGLLSERSAFAEAVTQSGATFIGPPSAALEAFGDKIRARQVALRVGVSPPPGSEQPVDPKDSQTLKAEAERIGLPLLIKAAAGGGGIGMQIVRELAELERAAQTCADRGLSAFGDGRIYLERYLEGPRHIEVQVFCDAHGNAVALGERECSVQRRHQKIIEESPSPAGFFSGQVGEGRRSKLFHAALSVVRAADYRGAGTVEFVANAAGELYFLEVNARLQVEHPVTELVTGLDLVELQLRVAAGEPLPPEALAARPEGHAIEVRLYAEDPQKGFLPQPGLLQRFELPSDLPGVRIDSGVVTGQEITPHYDPMLAKVAAHGKTREQALERLEAALAACRIELVGPKGPRATNLAFLRKVLASAEFGSGQYDTSLADTLSRELKRGLPAMSEASPNPDDSPARLSTLERARRWAASDPDPLTRAELSALIDARDHEELAERMLSDLEFGTAGLRGVVAAGSARMNLAVVIRVTRALADQLASRAHDARALPVVIGCDARLDSQRFADAAARVLLAAGIPVKRFAEPVPTPFVAYAVRAFAANAGIMITASHNPPEYNGYKLYWQNGVQVVPPTDHEIFARMRALGPANAIPLADLAQQELIGEDIVLRYLAEIRASLPRITADRQLRIVYTALHGVGASVVERLFREAGYADFHSVPEQREPDGRFPTVHFPNPEEPGALDLALVLAREKTADLVIANDPDVDRLAIAVPTASGHFRALTGNQIGLLLADFALSHADLGARALVLSSIVSSPMLSPLAHARGARYENVLTGFKWVWTAALALEAQNYRYCFGYEEALGYSFGRTVRDKDGISAALAFAELAAEARASGKTVLDCLHALYREHGLWVSVQHNVVLKGAAGAARITRAMQELLDAPPAALAGHAVSHVRDLQKTELDAPSWRGPALLVELGLAERGRVFVRPSGTEPKLKMYVDLLAPLAPDATVTSAEASALADALAVALALVTALGLDS